MSEYIITCDEETASWIGNDVESMREITRCRDCKHMSELHYRDMLGFGRETIVYRCDCFWNADELPEVEPDGFCAWGKPRDV